MALRDTKVAHMMTAESILDIVLYRISLKLRRGKTEALGEQ